MNFEFDGYGGAIVLKLLIQPSFWTAVANREY
jgi:hypothetical protein